MLARLVVLALLTGFVAAPASAQTLPCVSQATDPCVISSTVDVAVGTYDIRPKSLSIANKQITVTGAGELRILAANITLQPGARLVSDGTDGNTTITLDATGTMDIQSQGTSKSKIDVSGNFGGGTINLHSAGNLSVNGTLVSNATNTLGFGGTINVKSDTGDVTITGDPSLGIQSRGNAQGGGGTIALEATLGALNVSTQLVAKGGDCGSCEVDLTAGTTITTTAQGVIDMSASGEGDGGFLSVASGTDTNLAGNIFMNGSSDDTDGGAGGDVLITAGGVFTNGNLTISGRIEVNGAGQDASLTGFTVDGDGGSIDASATGFINVTGPAFGISKGFGQGDEFSYDANGNVTMAGEIDVSGDNFPADITVLSDQAITVSARLRSAAPIDANHPAALGGSVDVEGCQINVTATGQLVCTGPGGDPSGANFLAASTGTTIAGTLTATDNNEIDYRTSVPVITGTVTPAALLVNDPNLPCCGVQCPTTTTTTTLVTTSSTSSTQPPTTTSTTKPTTTSTSSTAPPTTTTSSTAVPITTTSSTHAPTTTTSSTAGPTTTTTSSTHAPTTTTSSTAAPTTTTSSTAAPTTTTSSTHAPTTTTSSTTIGSSTTTTTVVGSTTTSSTSSTAPTTTSSSSTTTLATTTTHPAASTTSTTGAPTSSTIVTTSTAPPPTTSTTQPSGDCTDSTTGIDAVRCRLDQMTTTIGQVDPKQLGGTNLARQLANNLAKAVKLTTDPTTPKKLKHAATQMKKFAAKLGRAVSKGKVDATLGNDLTSLATEARSQLLGLTAH